MPRASIALPPPSDGAIAAKLELAEALLASEDVMDCAQRALEWLGEHGGARQALCLIRLATDEKLVAIARPRIPRAKIEALSLSLDAEDHPLAAAFLRAGPTVLHDPGTSASLWSAFTGGSALAMPLPLGLSSTQRVGLLVASPASPSVQRELRWLSDPLGQSLARLRKIEDAKGIAQRGQRERDLLLSVINAVPDPILFTDTEGRIVVSNARAEALFAARDSESEGRRRAVSLNNMLFSAALSRAAIEDPGLARRELPLVDPSEGSDLLFEILSAVVRHPREGTGIVSILRNVTDLRAATEQIEENFRKLKIAEADSRAERDRLDLIIDSVADPILVTDPTGKILLMNTPAERLFTVPEGASTEEATRVVRANDAHFSSFVSNLFFAGASLRRRGEIGLVDPATGQPSPVEAISGKILSERGEVTAVVTILHDRTEALEKSRLYEQLKKATEELEQKVHQATAELVRRNELLQRQHIEIEQASQLKSQFLANMSHEFRTPLNAILGYTSMLMQGVNGDLQPAQKRNLGRVDSNAKHLLALINDILDISRIEAGKMPLHVSEFAVSGLVAEVFGELEPLIARSRLEVGADVEEGLPDLCSDRQKVKQIVLNLLTNAIKFTPQGSVKVLVSADAARQWLSIAVQDTGIGIAPHDQTRVFEDFRQADNSVTREYGGAGLGLSICRRLASMLDGRIALESELGKGSTFTLHLPRKTNPT